MFLMKKKQKKPQQSKGKKEGTEKKLERLFLKAEEDKKQGNLKSAAKCYSEAIKEIESDPQFGPSHPYVGIFSYPLSMCLRSIGDIEGSVKHIERAIPILEATPDLTEQLIESMIGYSEGLLNLKRYKQTEQALKKSFKLLEQQMNNLISNEELGREEKSRKKSFLEMDLFVLKDTQFRLKYEQKNYEEAEEIGINLLKSTTEPELKPLVLRSTVLLCEVYLFQGKMEKCKKLFERFISDKEPEEMVVYVLHLGNLCMEMKKYADAIHFFIKGRDYKRNVENSLKINCNLITCFEIERVAFEVEKSLYALRKMIEEGSNVPLLKSKFLQTLKSSIEVVESGPSFNITLGVTNEPLPPEATLEFTLFKERITKTLDNSKNPKIEINWKPNNIAEEKCYRIDTKIFNKGKLIGEHYIFFYNNN